MIRVSTVASFAFLLASCEAPSPDVSSEPHAISEDDHAAEGTAVAGQPSYELWQVTTSVDELTDAQVYEAVASFTSGNFQINVTIRCAGVSPVYELASFDHEGVPVPQVYEFQRWTQGPEPAVRYAVRVDGGKPASAFDIRPRYNNAITINSSPTFYEVDADKLVLASDLVFRLHLAGGDATVSVDQTDPALQSVLAPCTLEPEPAELVGSAEPVPAAEAALDTLSAPPTE